MRHLMWVSPLLLLSMQIYASAGTIAAGGQIQVIVNQPIDVHAWEPERIYAARVAQDVYNADWDIAIPRGADAELIVHQIDPGQITVELESVTVNGIRYNLDAGDLQYSPPDDWYQSVAAHGTEILVPAGAAITFQLQEPVHADAFTEPRA